METKFSNLPNVSKPDTIWSLCVKFGFYYGAQWVLNLICLCSMRAVLLVSVLALVAAHRENRMIQEVEQRHVVLCVVTVVQRH